MSLNFIVCFLGSSQRVALFNSGDFSGDLAWPVGSLPFFMLIAPEVGFSSTFREPTGGLGLVALSKHSPPPPHTADLQMAVRLGDHVLWRDLSLVSPGGRCFLREVCLWNMRVNITPKVTDGGVI